MMLGISPMDNLLSEYKNIIPWVCYLAFMFHLKHLTVLIRRREIVDEDVEGNK